MEAGQIDRIRIGNNSILSVSMYVMIAAAAMVSLNSFSQDLIAVAAIKIVLMQLKFIPFRHFF